MRNRFNQQLEYLNVELITMGALCEQAISAAIKALLERDSALAQQVLETESQINEKERNIESLCLKLLLQQQPVATDLRIISSALKMISDLERIGDQAADIAEISLHIQPSAHLDLVPIAELSRAAIQMVTDAVDSFVKKDLAMARQAMQKDDEVDQLFLQVRTKLIPLMTSEQNPEHLLDLLMIAKYLERIGDHAENVAEWVEYSITGHHKESNDH